ncbi:MAG TPA: DUF2127 domain-containing protein, partial [Terracidiphilus sp.]|nr:DUF2127 domain-containing protein [Terracidiphilus sp.]
DHQFRCHLPQPLPPFIHVASQASDPHSNVELRMTARICFGLLEAMTDSSTKFGRKTRRHNKFLVLIAVYKLLQALLFAAIGVGALHLLHQDVSDVLTQVATALRFNPESRFVNFILDEASLLSDPLLRRIGVVAFSYAGISLAEGIGLYLEKAWAEYLTLAITASFLPWEIFEVFRRLTWVRVGLLAVNVLVFLYLLKLVTDRRRLVEATEEAVAD